jgi:hypothetical protein
MQGRAILTENVKKRLGELLWGVFALSLSLSEAKCGVYPFGLALLCGYNGTLFPVFAGVFAAGFILGENGLHYSLLAMVAFGIRWLGARKDKGNSLWIKLTAAFIVTLALGLKEFTLRNVLFESAARAGSVFSILPLFTLLFSLDLKQKRITREISALGWVYAIVKAASVWAVGVFKPQLAAGGLITLYFARESAFFGGMCGFAAGMAAGIIYMPVLGIAGLAYGIFCDEMRRFALFFASSLSISSGVYLASLSGAFPEFIWALAGFFIFGIVRPRLKPVLKEQTGKKDKARTLKKLSAAFSTLSEVFYVENLPPQKSDISAALKTSLFSLCDKCRHCGARCSLDKYDMVNHLTEISCGNEDGLPDHFARFCPNSDLLVGRALSLGKVKRSEGEREARLLTEGYNSIARLLCTAGEKEEEEGINNRELSKKAAEVLKKLSIPYTFVCVRGMRALNVSVYGTDMAKINCSGAEIRENLSKVLGKNLSLPEFINRENGFEMILRTIPAVRLEYAKAESSKAGEPVSGDTIVTFESDSLMFYSLLADGMGSGRDAAYSSRLAALFLEKLITAGGDKKEALCMLNKLLLVKKNEVYTTIDLLEIDRLSGAACLIKAGAAPTYLYRDGKCYKLESSSPPAGVIEDLKVTQTSLNLKKGDMLVMVTDGVVPKDGNLYLPKDKKTASACAAAILEERKEFACRDDMSVCVIRAF